MKRICCVCKKYLGEKPGPKDMVTHGYCDPCLKIYKAKMVADFAELDQASLLASGYASKLRPDKTPRQDCLCGRFKKPGSSFCYRCYHLLPEDMRRDLYLRTGNGHEEALDDAVKYLGLGEM